MYRLRTHRFLLVQHRRRRLFSHIIHRVTTGRITGRWKTSRRVRIFNRRITSRRIRINCRNIRILLIGVTKITVPEMIRRRRATFFGVQMKRFIIIGIRIGVKVKMRGAGIRTPVRNRRSSGSGTNGRRWRFRSVSLPLRRKIKHRRGVTGVAGGRGVEIEEAVEGITDGF
ncbi:hypothetical protein HanIR_Chr12g0591711 [Helianthus annuus]|nr:hypothetical protein HanIR_Chr12g0591711 [Helianthus annuus]